MSEISIENSIEKFANKNDFNNAKLDALDNEINKFNRQLRNITNDMILISQHLKSFMNGTKENFELRDNNYEKLLNKMNSINSETINVLDNNIGDDYKNALNAMLSSDIIAREKNILDRIKSNKSNCKESKNYQFYINIFLFIMFAINIAITLKIYKGL